MAAGAGINFNVRRSAKFWPSSDNIGPRSKVSFSVLSSNLTLRVTENGLYTDLIPVTCPIRILKTSTLST